MAAAARRAPYIWDAHVLGADAAHRSTTAARGFDNQVSAERLRAVQHRAQSQTLGVRLCAANPRAIVMHRKPD